MDSTQGARITLARGEEDVLNGLRLVGVGRCPRRCEPCAQTALRLERFGRDVTVRIVGEAVELVQTGLIPSEHQHRAESFPHVGVGALKIGIQFGKETGRSRQFDKVRLSYIPLRP